MKIFKTAEVNEILNKYLKEEISFSRFVEMLNELATKKLTDYNGAQEGLENYIKNKICIQ